jgi:hypothetical protein
MYQFISNKNKHNEPLIGTIKSIQNGGLHDSIDMIFLLKNVALIRNTWEHNIRCMESLYSSSANHLVNGNYWLTNLH